MLQLIEINCTTSCGGFNFKITAAYQLDNKIHVIAKLSIPPGTWAMPASFTGNSDHCVVTTDTDKPLEVIYYLIDHGYASSIASIPNYASIKEENVPNLFREAKILYQPRIDALVGLRLADFEDKSTSHPLIFPCKQQNIKDINPGHILNIYTVVKKDAVKLVFETISTVIPREGYYTNFTNKLFNLPDDSSLLSFTDDLFAKRDDKLKFIANSGQSKTGFATHACEFYIPLQDPNKFFHFLLLVDIAVDLVKRIDNHFIQYSHIQMSRNSILACFKDLYVSNNKNSDAVIENEMDSSLEVFLTKPGTLHQPESVIHEIFQALLRENNSPQLNKLKSYIHTVYHSVNADEIAKEAEKLLKTPKHCDLLKPVIERFQKQRSEYLLGSTIINEANLNIAKISLEDSTEIAVTAPEEGAYIPAIIAPTLLHAYSPFEILRQIDIDSEVSRSLLHSHPYSAECLFFMHKCKLFDKNIARTKFIFATLIHTLSAMPAENRQELQALYFNLSCVPEISLNLATHQKIMEIALADAKEFKEIVNFIYQLRLTQQMTQQMVDQIFFDPHSYLFFSKLVPMDKLMLLLTPNINPKDVLTCMRSLTMPDWEWRNTRTLTDQKSKSELPEWLNTNTFTDIALHCSQGEDVIYGFNALHRFKLLDTHKDQFLQNLSSAKVLRALYRGVNFLSPETIILALSHPDMLDAVKAMQVCKEHRVAPDDNQLAFLTKLSNKPQLVAMINILGEKLDFSYKSPIEVKREDWKILKELITLMGFPNTTNQTSCCSEHSFFPTPASPRSLDAYIAKLQDKYISRTEDDQRMSESSSRPRKTY